MDNFCTGYKEEQKGVLAWIGGQDEKVNER